MSRLTHIFHNDAHEAPFTMRVVGDGDRYGRGMALTHSGTDPLIEFYDRRWDHDRDPDGLMLGQFISLYRLSTLLETDRDGATAFETGIMLDAGTAWRVSPEGMADCLRALMDADLVPDPEAERAARIEALSEKIDAYLNTRLEEAETSPTAGDSYTHLPREGGWAYNNGDRRLAGWMRRVGIDAQGLEIEEISDLVLDNFRMEPGSMEDPTHRNDDLFLVDSFPMGEIAFELKLSELDPGATPEEWAEAKTGARAHFSGGQAHMSSDRVWYALIDRSALEGLIAQAVSEPEPSP